MVDSAAGLILPLMHHLMQKRLDRLTPSVTPNMSTADHDFGTCAGFVTMRVMAKPALHSARYADWNLVERAAESFAIQIFVRAKKPLRHALIIRMYFLRRSVIARRRCLASMHVVSE